MAKTKTDPRVDKRRVTMSRYSTMVIDGKPTMVLEEAVDFVRPDHLDDYLADANTKWQDVTVSDEPDAGPGGYHGQTVAPSGEVFPETPEDERD